MPDHQEGWCVVDLMSVVYYSLVHREGESVCFFPQSKIPWSVGIWVSLFITVLHTSLVQLESPLFHHHHHYHHLLFIWVCWFGHDYYFWVGVGIGWMFYLCPAALMSQVCWIGCPSFPGKTVLWASWRLAQRKRWALVLVTDELWLGLQIFHGQ